MKTLASYWRWWLAGYLVLLALSHLWQWAPWKEPPAVGTPAKTTLTLVPIRSSGSEGDGTITVALRDLGPRDSPSIILLHGSPGSSSDFRHVADSLATQYRVIVLDLPGFGDSTRWIPDYGIDTHAAYVLAMMDALQIDRAHVFGFSMGGGVALEMIDAAPQRVRSLALFGAIGIQEGEGSGDYTFEHIKYGLGFPLVVVLPELIPHFGALGSTAFRYSFIRNFWDTDQRPLRDILERLDTPTLILHGVDDFLVPLWVAREHHDLIRNSRLVILKGEHFQLFDEESAAVIAEEYLVFLSDVAEDGRVRHTTTRHAPAPADEDAAALPVDLGIDRQLGPWLTMGAIIVGTFILEDAVSITVGLLIRDGQLDLFVGLFACFAGIVLGDLGLFAIGWFGGKRILAWPSVAKRLPARHLDGLGRWFDRHGWTAILASRFIPGTRTPLYIAAGALGQRQWKFLLWVLIAVSIWTPTIIIAVILFGRRVTEPFEALFGEGWLSIVAAVITIIIVLRVLVLSVTHRGRQRLRVGVSRLWRWEFWPVWLFYLPLVPNLISLALKHRSLTVPTAANPGIAHGGIVGESKFAILRQLPSNSIVPSALVEPGNIDARVEQLRRAMRERQWDYPLILKPDVGERGEGLKFIADEPKARAYLQQYEHDVLVQTYDPGPYEAGIFYYRMPNESIGHIFSITDKQFPELIGDGTHTLADLIWAHPRFRMQARTFLRRHSDRADSIPAAGERVALAISGNHCQGTMFLDGTMLITDELEQAIDRIAQQFDGFYFGRFDVRYRNVESFKRGTDFAIVELNGVLSESSNIYDPRFSFRRAQATLRRQWALCFAIGAQNAGRGCKVTAWRDLRRLIRAHRRRENVEDLAD